jgi:hypothetical protein
VTTISKLTAVLWFPKILSGRIRTVRQNQRIIAFDACAPPLACRLYRQSCSSRDNGLRLRTLSSVINSLSP